MRLASWLAGFLVVVTLGGSVNAQGLERAKLAALLESQSWRQA